MVTSLSAQNTESTILHSDCGDNDLRLVEGPSANEGKIEICTNGFWGTLCSSYRFGDADARVVCRQLGFQTLGMVSSCLEFGRLSSFLSNNPHLVVNHHNSYHCTTFWCQNNQNSILHSTCPYYVWLISSVSSWLIFHCKS